MTKLKKKILTLKKKLDHFKIFSSHIFSVDGAQVKIEKYLRKREIEKKMRDPREREEAE